MIDRLARRIAFRLIARISTGRLTVIEGEQRRSYGSGPPAAAVHVYSPKLWRRLLLRGSRGLAEGYADGLWDSPDVTAVVRLAARNVDGIDGLRRRLAPMRAPFQWIGALLRNSRRRSRRAISAHYDLGNDLFSLMLDPTMMYSAAVFEEPRMTLEEASLAKLERICDRLELGPDDHVMEIGTGWGGFAVHAAGTRGCRVTTTTISREQHDYAVERVREAGLSDRVTVLLEDYRDLDGVYDKLVSIEMIEAVGWRHFGTFFEKCSSLLKPDGAMLLQAITIDDRAYEVEKGGRSFINTHIFPEGCLPSLEVISRCVARRTDMQTVALEDITSHYAETIRHWRANFEANAERAAEMGYDGRFRRMWHMYLSWCEAGFAERRICDVQVLLAKPRRRSALRAEVRAAAEPRVSAADAG